MSGIVKEFMQIENFSVHLEVSKKFGKILGIPGISLEEWLNMTGMQNMVNFIRECDMFNWFLFRNSLVWSSTDSITIGTFFLCQRCEASHMGSLYSAEDSEFVLPRRLLRSSLLHIGCRKWRSGCSSPSSSAFYDEVSPEKLWEV